MATINSQHIITYANGVATFDPKQTIIAIDADELVTLKAYLDNNGYLNSPLRIDNDAQLKCTINFTNWTIEVESYQALKDYLNNRGLTVGGDHATRTDDDTTSKITLVYPPQELNL